MVDTSFTLASRSYGISSQMACAVTWEKRLVGMDRLLDLVILPHAADVTIDDGNGTREDEGGAGAQPHDLEVVARRRERLPAALGS